MLLASTLGCRKTPPPAAVDAGAPRPAAVEEPHDAAVVTAPPEPTEPQEFVLETSDAGPAAPSTRRTFVVQTEPPDAVVSLNHHPVGRSPVTFEAPSNVVWGLLLELPGYLPVDLSVWPQPKPADVMRFELKPIPVEPIDAGQPMVTLEVDSFPWGFVLIDDVDAGLAPVTIQVTPGSHEVKVMHAACIQHLETITANPGESRRVFGKLLCWP